MTKIIDLKSLVAVKYTDSDQLILGVRKMRHGFKSKKTEIFSFSKTHDRKKRG